MGTKVKHFYFWAFANKKSIKSQNPKTYNINWSRMLVNTGIGQLHHIV